jgi:ABC-2 type transport system permease protein
VQLAFFLTPHRLDLRGLPQQPEPRDRRAGRLAELNPFLHFVEILRRPLLGQPQELRFWIVVLVITVVGWALTLSCCAGTGPRLVLGVTVSAAP